ncbi:hypothetical protein D6777_00525 [Candidatus Woesearchaeota archaeon]|nr:MAG: hypothetical protein D6777_00525 [Candidatus Woesearchaeota archaeon]
MILMKMEVLKEKDVTLMDRRRVTLLVDFEGKATPSSASLRKDVASFLKTKPNLISIRHIYQKFGDAKAKVIVHVYKSEDKLKLFEGESAVYKEEKAESSEEKAESSEEKAESPSEEKAESPSEEKAESPSEEKAGSSEEKAESPSEDKEVKEEN